MTQMKLYLIEDLCEVEFLFLKPESFLSNLFLRFDNKSYIILLSK